MRGVALSDFGHGVIFGVVLVIGVGALRVIQVTSELCLGLLRNHRGCRVIVDVCLVALLVGDGRCVDEAALCCYRLPRHLLGLVTTHVALVAAVIIYDAIILLFI